jgi:hypothetical protein
MKEGTSQPLGLDVWAGLSARPQDPLSADDWDERLKQMEKLGMGEDSLLMRGAEWRKGLAGEREAFQKDTRDSLRRALGFKSTETSGALGAAASAGKAATASSL